MPLSVRFLFLASIGSSFFFCSGLLDRRLLGCPSRMVGSGPGTGSAQSSPGFNECFFSLQQSLVPLTRLPNSESRVTRLDSVYLRITTDGGDRPVRDIPIFFYDLRRGNLSSSSPVRLSAISPNM